MSYCPSSKPCAKCRAWEAAKVVNMPNGSKRRACDSCGCGIPPYAHMQGAGFQAETIDHYWVEEENGKNFHMPVQMELCYQCYMKDYAANYPNAKLPEIVNVRDFEDVPQSITVAPEPSPWVEYFTVTYA